jgi:hypothetical protein
MAWIGREPLHGEIIKLDSLTASATATYALTRNGAAYSPPSAENCLVWLNGILQVCNDAYSIQGSNLVFSEALTSSDVINGVVVLGNGHLPTGTPSAGTIQSTHLSSTIYREGIRINSGTITSNVTIASGERGMVAGNITINSGVTLTVNGEMTIV